MRKLAEHAELGVGNQSSIAACGGIELLLQALEAFPAALDIQEPGVAAIASLSRDHVANGVHFGDLGGIGAVLFAMQAFPAAGDLQGWALLALRNLAWSSTGNCSAITSAGGVDTCVATMRQHRGLVRVQGCGCALLGNLSLVSAEQRHVIAAGGGVEAVVSALAAHVEEAKVQCCGFAALGNLALDSAEVRAAALAAGGLELVVKAMRVHVEVSEVQELGCSVLRNLAHAEGGCGPHMVSVGGVPAVVEALGAHLEVNLVQRPALQAILNLLKCDAVTPVEIASRGCIDGALVAAQFHAGDVQLQETALEILRAVGYGGHHEHRDRLADLDTPEFVTEVMRDRAMNASIQASGCALLHSLAAHGLEHSECIGSFDGVELVIGALQRFTDNIEVCLHGCAALQCLALDAAANQARLYAHGGIEALVECVRVHMASAPLQEHACGAFRNLAVGGDELGDELKPALSSLGSIEAVLDAMKEHIHHPKLQEYGLQFLERMAHERPSDQAKMIEAGAIGTTLSAMGGHVADPAVQAAGCTVLAALAAETIDFGQPPPPPESDEDSMDEEGTFIAIPTPGSPRGGSPPAVAGTALAEAGDAPSVLLGLLDGREIITAADGHEFVLAALKEHRAEAYVQECGFSALLRMHGDARDGDAEGRRLRELDTLSQSDGVEIVLDGLRAHAAAEKVQELGCAALRMLACGKNNCKEELVLCGGAEVVIHALQTHAGAGPLQDTCCAMLASLLALTEVPVRDAEPEAEAADPEADGEEDLASSVEDTSPKTMSELLASLGAMYPTLSAMKAYLHVFDVQKNATGLIMNWAAQNEELREQVVGLGGMTLVLTAMRTYPGAMDLQLSGCTAVCGMSVDARYGLQKTIASTGGIDLVLGAMRAFPASAPMQTQACAALRGLCVPSEDMAAIAWACGSLGTVLAAMQRHAEEELLQEHATVLLSVLAAADENREGLVADSTPELVTEAMRTFRGNQVIQEFGCVVLAKLPRCDMFIQNRMAALDAIELSVDAIRQHKSASLAERVCAALESLVLGNAANQRRMEDAGGVRLVLKQLQYFPNETDVQHGGWRALWAVSRSQAGAKTPLMISSTGGVALALKAMEKHNDVPQIQAFACAVLMSVAVASPEYLERIALLGAPNLITAAMRIHEASALVQVFACSGIQMLAAGNEAALRFFNGRDDHDDHVPPPIGRQLVEAALQNFPDDPQVQHFGHLAMQTLDGVAETGAEEDPAMPDA